MTPEEHIKNLPPKERVEALRRLREEKRKELEEAERRHQEEEAESEEMLKSSIEELTQEEERVEEDRLKNLRAQLEKLDEQEHSLEDAVQEEQQRQGLEAESSYKTGLEDNGPANAYNPLSEIADDFQRLQYTSQWGQDDVNLYNQRKTEFDQAQQYKNTMGEDALAQLDVAKNMLDRLGYKS